MKRTNVLKKLILLFCLLFIFGCTAKAEMVNNFESYTSDAELQLDWQKPYYAGNGTYTLTLDNTNGINGSKALKYYYVVGSATDPQHLYSAAMGSVNWANYDKLRFWYRPVGCNAGRTWQAYLRSAVNYDDVVSVVTIDNFTTQSNEWHVMEFDLDMNGKPHDTSYFIGCFYGLAPGDSGTIYFDNFELVKEQIHESDGSTSVFEKGVDSDSYTVNLESAPTADVTVTVAPQDATLDIGNGPGVSKVLTFTTANWDVPQTVTVKSADGVNVTVKTVVVINHTASNGESIISVNVNILPDTFEPSMVNDFESYTSDAQLQADWQKPYYAGNGTYTLTLDNTNGIDGSKALKYYYVVGSTTDAQHLFSTAMGNENWADYDKLRFWYRPVGCNAGRTWQAYLRSAVNSNDMVSVVTIDNFTTQSNEWHVMEFDLDMNGKPHDTSYFIGYFYGLAPGDSGTIYFDNLELVKEQIHESDESTNVMSRGVETDSYTINLAKRPAADVTVTAVPQDASIDIGNGPGVSKVLTFTTANWDVLQTVTVKSANDVDVTDATVAVIDHTASNGESIRSVNVNIWPLTYLVDDFESYGNYIEMNYIWPSGGVWGDGASAIQDLSTTISHGGMQSIQSMQYALSGNAGDAVGYTMSSFPAVDCRMYDYARLWYRGDAANISGGEMHFILRNPTSYDNLGEAVAANLQNTTWQPLTIKFDKSDKWKNIGQVLMGVFPNPATVWYDDVAFYKSPVDVIENNGIVEVNEGSSTTYKIKLLDAPTANVTITAHTDGLTTVDSGFGAGQIAQVVFTPTNYSTEQTIIVNAIDDSILNLDCHSLITHTAASSDASYAECIIADVNVVIHDNECGAWGYMQGDLNKDCRVNIKDFALLAINWLGDIDVTPLQDFESYNEETFANSWEAYYNSTHPSSLVLLTDPAYAQTGQKAAQWSYDFSGSATDGKCEILYTLDSPVDLSQYDEVRVWIKRHADNSDEHLFYIKFLNNGGMLANIAGESLVYDGATLSNPDAWTQWAVDLHNLNYDYASGNGYNSLDDITSMTHILFGIWSSTTLGDMGSGVIDLDAISFGVFSSGDLDKNGKIDFADFAILSDKWLGCTNPQLSGCENLF